MPRLFVDFVIPGAEFQFVGVLLRHSVPATWRPVTIRDRTASPSPHVWAGGVNSANERFIETAERTQVDRAIGGTR